MILTSSNWFAAGSWESTFRIELLQVFWSAVVGHVEQDLVVFFRCLDRGLCRLFDVFERWLDDLWRWFLLWLGVRGRSRFFSCLWLFIGCDGGARPRFFLLCEFLEVILCFLFERGFEAVEEDQVFCSVDLCLSHFDLVEFPE